MNMGHAGGSFSPGVLVVVAEEALRQAFIGLLREEGYPVAGVASFEEALSAGASAAFALMLADLPTIRSAPSSALRPRHHTPALPLGILKPQADALQEDVGPLAFTLSEPFEIARLLTEVAACLQRPLGPEQLRQAAVLRRLLKALSARASGRLSSLCAEDLSYSPSGTILQRGASSFQGREAIQAYVSSVWQNSHHLRLEASDIYSRPRGLALRYMTYATTPGGDWAGEEAAELFQFVGERISEIGFRSREESQDR